MATTWGRFTSDTWYWSLDFRLGNGTVTATVTATVTNMVTVSTARSALLAQVMTLLCLQLHKT